MIDHAADELLDFLRQGLPLGQLRKLLTQAVPHWWVLPIAGTIIGYATNWLAISMIFEPIEPRRVGRFTWQGLFLKRQDAASEVYAHIIADEIVRALTATASA